MGTKIQLEAGVKIHEGGFKYYENPPNGYSPIKRYYYLVVIYRGAYGRGREVVGIASDIDMAPIICRGRGGSSNGVKIEYYEIITKAEFETYQAFGFNVIL